MKYIIQMNGSLKKFCLGTANFGQVYGLSKKRLSEQEISKIIKFSSENGIFNLDTAINYGDSENILGNIGIKNWKVITKIPNPPIQKINESSWAIENVLKSIKRLNVNQLEGVLFHSSETLKNQNAYKIFDALLDLKSKGVIKKLGVSVYNPSEIKYILERFELDIVQLPLNVFDRRILHSEVLSILLEKRIEIHARSIFLQGCLLKKLDKLPSYFNKWSDIFNKWEEWLKENSISPLNVCLKFVAENKNISKFILGIDNISQFLQVIKILSDDKPIPIPPIFSNDINLVNPSKWMLS